MIEDQKGDRMWFTVRGVCSFEFFAVNDRIHCILYNIIYTVLENGIGRYG